MSDQNLRNEALALAAAQSLCMNDDVGWFEAYEHLVMCVETEDHDRADEKFMLWEPLECTPLHQLLEHIEGEAESILRGFKYVLETVKKGIVDATIEGELDSDANEMDMIGLYERGAAIEQKEATNV